MISCHCRIIPSFLLSKRAIFTGIRSWVSVISSWNVIWKPPSPVIAQVSRSGRPSAAPTPARPLTLPPPRRGGAEAHRAQAAGAHVRVRLPEPGIAGKPHLVLADVGDVGRGVVREAADAAGGVGGGGGAGAL